MRVTATWTDGYRSVTGNGRGHEVVVDLPPAKGGADAGPTALELCGMSLAGCITTIFAVVANKRRLPWSGVSVELDVTQPEAAPTVDAARGRIVVRSSAPRPDVETAVRLTLQECPVGVLFDQAGVTPEVEIVVESGGPTATGPAAV